MHSVYNPVRLYNYSQYFCLFLVYFAWCVIFLPPHPIMEGYEHALMRCLMFEGNSSSNVQIIILYAVVTMMSLARVRV